MVVVEAAMVLAGDILEDIHLCCKVLVLAMVWGMVCLGYCMVLKVGWGMASENCHRERRGIHLVGTESQCFQSCLVTSQHSYQMGLGTGGS